MAEPMPITRKLTVTLVITEARPAYRRSFAEMLIEVSHAVKHGETNKTSRFEGIDDETGETYTAFWKFS